MEFSQERWRERLDGAIQMLTNRGFRMNFPISYLELLSAINDSELVSASEKIAFNTLFVKMSSAQKSDYNYSSNEAAGRADVEYVKKTFPNESILKLTEEVDYAQIYYAQLAEQESKDRKIRNRIFAVLAGLAGAVILWVVIYNLPYFAEKRAYARTLEYPSIYTLNQYTAHYHNPEHLPDVMYRKAMLLLKDPEQLQPGTTPVRKAIESLDSIVTLFPSHEFAAKSKVTIDSLWDAEIKRFLINNKNIEESRSLSTMYKMLQFMKENGIYDIGLKINSTVNLKEYNEFSKEVRDELDALSPMLPGVPMLKIKEQFDTPTKESMEQQLIDELSRSINQLFTPGFFSLLPIESGDTTHNDLPVINVDYTIKTQSETIGGFEIPGVWVWRQRNMYSDIPSVKGYLVGIDMIFSSSLNFPGLEQPWSIKLTGAPEDNIENINGVSDGYRVMIRKCFEDFGNQLHALLGLPPAEEEIIGITHEP